MRSLLTASADEPGSLTATCPVRRRRGVELGHSRINLENNTIAGLTSKAICPKKKPRPQFTAVAT
ncbi:MAG: hypothetical protein JWL86_5825, partial [Rhizobium sp.]|nr:hypothetical protein [Rhizobium sp.]